MTTPIAVLRGVSKNYGSTRALRPLDLDLHPGVIGLLGPNGAGKSTLLRLLATSLPPVDRPITVAGHEVTGTLPERTAASRLLGYLPQEVGLPQRMTAFGFLDYIAVLKEWSDSGTRHAEVRRVLDLVGLGDRGTKRISALSGGQRRRLALAQALMGDPRLVVLDEPTTGLDPEQRASLRGILSEQARTSAVLLATHQTEDVSALCDRVIVLDAGGSASTAPSATYRDGRGPGLGRPRGHAGAQPPGGPAQARCGRSVAGPIRTRARRSPRPRTPTCCCATSLTNREGAVR